MTKFCNAINDDLPANKITKKFLISLLSSVLAIIITLFTVLQFTNASKANIVVYDKNDTKDNQMVDETKIKMLKLGFDESVLNDLPNSEILKYQNIKSVNKTGKIQESDGGELQMISFVSTLDDGLIRFFYYYKWNINPTHNYTDLIGISLFMDHFTYKEDYKLDSLILYDKIEDSKVITYKSDTVGKTKMTEGFAAKFRVYKNEVNNQRGYIAFNLRVSSYTKNLAYNTCLLYTHQKSILNIPYKDIMTFYKISGGSTYKDLVFESYIQGTSEDYIIN